MTDLTDRMRTCVAGLQTIEVSIVLTDAQMEAIIDARALLISAAEELEKPIEVRLGEPMAVIPPPPPETPAERYQRAKREMQKQPPIPKNHSGPVWTDPCTALPTVPLSKNACPKCDSRASKTVRAGKGRISLECPVCSHIWWR